METSIDLSGVNQLKKYVEHASGKVNDAMRLTVKDMTKMAREYVKQPNIGFKTSYSDTIKLPLQVSAKEVSSGIENTSDAFPYFEYGTGTGSSEGAMNGEWYVPVDKVNLAKYYPTTPDGKYYVVKPQRAQMMFHKTSDLVEREMPAFFMAYLEKELKNG